MNSVLYYILGLGAFVTIAGAVIAVYAVRNAPEGYEDEQEGFVGVTKGDELLLAQYKEQHFSSVHGPMDVAA